MFGFLKKCHPGDRNRKKIFPDSERAKLSNRELWYKKRNYCIDKCDRCEELDMLKKIYWEIRKQNEILK